MSNIAHQTDWKTEPMPDETDNLHFHRIFSSEEFERVRLGLVPREMEDKWFIYYENHMLNIHRSWTGFHIYKIIMQPTNIAGNEPVQINAGDRLGGCLAGGTIGDATGSFYEGQSNIERINAEMVHGITDDTQLTMATCESIIESGQVSAASIAHYMLTWYNKGKLTGLGASTLKALRDLQMGAHWALAGRSGEYAAGNGAAMRIAPLAFFINPETDRTLIRDVCSITHKNDEAYVGSLAILYSLHYIITNKWLPGISLQELITPNCRIPPYGIIF